jgi:hypothetical protein
MWSGRSLKEKVCFGYGNEFDSIGSGGIGGQAPKAKPTTREKYVAKKTCPSFQRRRVKKSPGRMPPIA